MKIYIINGPNLNALGKRQPDIYGYDTLEDIHKSLCKEFPGTEFIEFQSNCEGEIIDTLYKAFDDKECMGVVVNPGAYAHYSYAIADAIRSIDKIVVEVHISNIHAREEFRSNTVTGSAASAIITGAGTYGYNLAVQYLLHQSSTL